MADVVFEKLRKIVNSQECENMITHLQDKDNIQDWARFPLMKQWAKHTAGHDLTAGIEELSSMVLQAKRASHIGTNLINRFNTTSDSIKVRVPTVGKAVKTEAGKISIASHGARNGFITLTPDTELEASEEWDLKFLEDSEWNVSAQQAAEVGISLRQLESQFFIDKLISVTTAGSAGLVTKGANAALTPDMLLTAWGNVLTKNGDANTLVLNPAQVVELLKNSEFKNQLILGQFANYQQGQVGMFLGMQLYVSTQIPAGAAYAFDKSRLLLAVYRRDRLMVPFSNKVHSHGIQVSSRLGVEFGDTEICSPIRAA